MCHPLYNHDSTLFRIRNRRRKPRGISHVVFVGQIRWGEWAASRLPATRFVMTYRVYSGPKGSADVSPLEKSESFFKQLHTLDDALSWARHLERTDRIPLLIEGDDGTRMDRRAIVDALRVGMREDVGGPGRAHVWCVSF